MKTTAIAVLLGLCGLGVLGVVLGFNNGPELPTSPQEFRAWFEQEDNGFIRTKTIGAVTFAVQQRPAELMAANEIFNSTVTAEAAAAIQDGYRNSRYFALRISPTDAAGPQAGDAMQAASLNFADYSDKIKYLSYHLQEHTQLVAGGDTIEPSIYHYERGYEANPVQTFLFAFPRMEDRADDALTFIFNDPIFQAGRLKFRFDQEAQLVPEIPIH